MSCDRSFCFVLVLILLAFPVKLEGPDIETEDNAKELFNKREVENNGHYSNNVAVELDKDDEALADEVARTHGYINNGRIGSLQGFFEFQHDETTNRERRSLRASLVDHPRVKWAEEQVEFERFKRGYEEDCAQRLKREDHNRIAREKELILEKRKDRQYFHDPMFQEQWYLNNYGQDGHTHNDINVLPVYKRGITGKGVVVSILDDGLDHTHKDLERNYDPKASTNLNPKLPGHDSNDPHPRDSDPYNAHGTKCGGEVGAQADNNVCGAGIAPNVKLGGVRMLDTASGKSSDSLEARALSFNRDYIDIYSNCWGPKDDGKTFGRPGKLGMKALADGAKYGRGGKGSIYTWATGNGGGAGDNCNCDGYTSSIYTISIGAVDKRGKSTYYDEKCSSTTAVIFTDYPLVTTDLHHRCTNRFMGTSAAAPLAAGVFALVLEANRNLTWRDMQHIIVKTAKNTSECDPGWRRNAAGNTFNIKFGFGRIDAYAMVMAALNWKNVPEQLNCTLEGTSKDRNIPRGGRLVLTDVLSGCAITKLEHVQLIVTLKHRRRGDLSIVIKSPQGTESTLLTNRPDDSDKGLKDWAFMTLHLWGENPAGKWQVLVNDNPHAKSRRKPVRKDEIPGVMEDPRDEIHHGRTGEDYMRDEIPEVIEDPRDKIHHGRTGEDYMRDEIPEVLEDPRDEIHHDRTEDYMRNETPEVMEDPRDEIHHGRTVEDYMRDEVIQEDDVSQRDDVPYDLFDEDSPVTGHITKYSYVFYGTKD